MKKNDKGQTVVQISYEKGKTNGRKIVCGTEAEYDKYWEEYRAKNGGDGGSTSTSDNPVDKATKKVKSGLKIVAGGGMPPVFLCHAVFAVQLSIRDL